MPNRWNRHHAATGKGIGKGGDGKASWDGNAGGSWAYLPNRKTGWDGSKGGDWHYILGRNEGAGGKADGKGKGYGKGKGGDKGQGKGNAGKGGDSGKGKGGGKSSGKRTDGKYEVCSRCNQADNWLWCDRWAAGDVCPGCGKDKQGKQTTNNDLKEKEATG